jgi:hypothetical protein
MVSLGNCGLEASKQIPNTIAPRNFTQCAKRRTRFESRRLRLFFSTFNECRCERCHLTSLNTQNVEPQAFSNILLTFMGEEN